MYLKMGDVEGLPANPLNPLSIRHWYAYITGML